MSKAETNLSRLRGNSPLLPLALVFLAAVAVAQSKPQVRFSRTKEDLRGASAVSQKVAWASGTHGTYLRMTDSRLWIPEQVPGAETLDFRGMVAFSPDEAFLMSSGPGDRSRIYHTGDAGRHWELQFTDKNPKGFFDSIVFWDRTHGLVLGDPVPDENGIPKFELLMTADGKNWNTIPSAQFPPAIEGEGAFAASNSCLTILGGEDPNVWFATGGKAARVFHSPDRGRTWEVFDSPIVHGLDSEGIFSIAFRDPLHGVIAGGDYKRPERDGPNLALTADGGRTWTVSMIFPQSYYSSVAYDRSYSRSNRPGKAGAKANEDSGVRIFLVGPKFIYDFRPPQNPVRISPLKKSGLGFNAVSPYPSGGALIVGSKGAIANVP
jgi:photosystem II stability/assembly factor-like uncharacterized protein